MAEGDLAGLLAGYLDGDLEPQAREELAAAVEHDPAAAREFDAGLRTEALLCAAHLEFPPRSRICAGVRARMKPSAWTSFAAASMRSSDSSGSPRPMFSLTLPAKM